MRWVRKPATSIKDSDTPHNVRPGDTVARLGGDEFAIVLEQLADPGDAETTIERLRLALRQPITLHCGNSVTVGASIGAVTSLGTDDPHELLHQADMAMYAEKQHGTPQPMHTTTGNR